MTATQAPADKTLRSGDLHLSGRESETDVINKISDLLTKYKITRSPL